MLREASPWQARSVRGVVPSPITSHSTIPFEELKLSVWQVTRGHQFFTPHDRVRDVFVVVSGRVRLSVASREGNVVAVDLLDAGAVFGESALLGYPAGVTAEAMEDCEVAKISAERLQQLMLRYPKIAIDLLADTARRLQSSHEFVEEIAFWSVGSRLARVLLELSARYGHPTVDGACILNRSFTHEALAESIASRRPTVSQWMRRLVEGDVVEMRGTRIVILNSKELRAMVDAQTA
jgi:CRP/FNR family transcriptional regulator